MDFKKTIGFVKTTKEMNKCPVCGYSRMDKSKNHGKCMESLAMKEKEKTVKVRIKDRDCNFSIESRKKAESNRGLRLYDKKDLPVWMYD
jgi:hypothetical protein